MPDVTWTRDLAAHLLRRAGFGSSRAERERYYEMGLEKAVGTLVDYETVPNAGLDVILGQREFDFTRKRDIQDWWLLRMLYTARPLEEKMVFFWHNYFATSIEKVDNILMKLQNDLFRTFALGNFKDLLIAVSRDPAMLIWLDNRVNRVGRPNENYARELMELFSTGLGHYTETDIQEIARCFTGWTLRQGEYYFQPGGHDDGSKTFLGVTLAPGGGESDGIRVCETLAAHPATPRYLVGRLFEAFVYANPAPRVVDRFADIYERTNDSVREVMRAILRSNEFYSEKALFGTVKTPTEFAVGALKALEATVEVRRLAEDLRDMGQELLAPPDVFGWDADLAWVATTTMLARYNWANGLATNRSSNRTSRIDPATLLAGGDYSKPNKLVNHFLDMLGPLTAGKKQRKALKNYLLFDDQGVKQPFVLDTATIDKKVRGLVHLILTMPEYQLN